MTGLALVAASGLAREVLAVEAALAPYDEIVVVDDDPIRWGTELAGHPVLVGGIERLAGLPHHRVVVCAGSGRARRAIVARLASAGVGPQRFATVRHPSVEVPAGCAVGHGSILLANVTLTCDVRIGRHVVAMPGVTLTHDDVVADYATLCAGVSLGGGVVVGEAAYLGMNASVRQGVVVGPEATLGMGAALVAPLPAGETWVGVPARPAEQPARVGS
jgi:sugar O-acyltransferase (sialic acid O-acetyltransferase NeuD family)